MATEAVRRSLGSVLVSTVQLVLTERHCSVDVQVRLDYAVTEESRSGSAADARSYRPISKLSVIWKLIERLVSKQLLTSEVPQGQ